MDNELCTLCGCQGHSLTPRGPLGETLPNLATTHGPAHRQPAHREASRWVSGRKGQWGKDPTLGEDTSKDLVNPERK